MVTLSDVSAARRPPRRLRLLTHVTGAVVIAAGLVGLGAAPAGAGATFEARMLELTNQARASHGAPALVAVPQLSGIAGDAPYSGCGYGISGRATDMGVRQYFSHVIANCGGRSVFDMLTASGVQSQASAENIGWSAGTTDERAAAEAIHNGFMGSPTHRANLLNPSYTAVGIGSWATAPGQTWAGAGAPRANVTVAAVVFAQMTVTAPPPPPPPPPSEVPAAPAWAAATPANGGVHVQWAGVPNPPGGPVDGYGLFAFTADGYAGQYTVACATCRTGSISGLRNGTYYVVAVAAHSPAGWGAVTVTGWFVAGAPSAPQNVSAAGAPAGADVSWSAPVTANGSAIDAYAALAFDAHGNYVDRHAVTGPSERSARVTGLTPGQTYLIVVTAHNARGWSPTGASGWVTAR